MRRPENAGMSRCSLARSIVRARRRTGVSMSYTRSMLGLTRRAPPDGGVHVPERVLIQVARFTNRGGVEFNVPPIAVWEILDVPGRNPGPSACYRGEGRRRGAARLEPPLVSLLPPPESPAPAWRTALVLRRGGALRPSGSWAPGGGRPRPDGADARRCCRA